MNDGKSYYPVDQDMAVVVYGGLEENVVKSTCGGNKLELNVGKDENFPIQNPTFEILTEKQDSQRQFSDTHFFGHHTALKKLIQKLTPCQRFNSKTDTLYELEGKISRVVSI